MSRIESLFKELEEQGEFLDHGFPGRPEVFFILSEEKYIRLKEMFI